MKKTIYFIAFIIAIGFETLAQPAIQWQYSFGGTLKDGFTSGNTQQGQVDATSDGGCVFTGFSFSNDGDVTGHHGLPAVADCWVAKLDDTGSLEWQRSLGGSDEDRGHSVKQTSDGGYVLAVQTASGDGDVTGYHMDSVSLPSDAWIVKLDMAGNIEWEHAFGGAARDIVLSVIQTSDGNFVGAGRTSSNDGDVSGNHGATDIWIIKISTTGALLWQKCIGGSASDYAYTIRETPDHGFILSGDLGSTDGDFTGAVLNTLGATFVLKTDSVANVEWFQVLGGNSLEMGFDVFPTQDGGYIVGINSSSSDLPNAHGITDYYILKLDAGGSIQWQQCYGGSDNDWFKALFPATYGGYVLIGESSSADGDVSNNYGGSDAWVVKIDEQGVIQWEHAYGGSEADDGTSIVATADGGFILGVESNSNDFDVSGHHGALSESDIWIAKLAPDYTFVNETRNPMTSLSASPNPVTSSARVSFHLAEAGFLRIEVYNVQGQIITTLADKWFPAGNSSLTWDAGNQPEISQGVYCVKITGQNFTRNTKIIAGH